MAMSLLSLLVFGGFFCFVFRLKQIEATNTAVRLVFRSHKKLC